MLGLGIEVLVSVGLGRYFYGEQLTAAQVVGALLILAGVPACASVERQRA